MPSTPVSASKASAAASSAALLLCGASAVSYTHLDVYKRQGEIRRRGNTSLRIFLNYISFPVTALFKLPRLHGRKYDAVFLSLIHILYDGTACRGSRPAWFFFTYSSSATRF